VHRDIKPANLMLVSPPAGYPLPPGLPLVKVADFGLALLEGDLDGHTRLTAPETTVGSPRYMAPEQLESSHVDHRADIYALGATAFHALTARPPFAELKLSQLIAAKFHDGPPRVSTLQPGVSLRGCELISRLLARSPEDRPQDYSALLGEIDAVLETLPGSGASSPPRRSPELAADSRTGAATATFAAAPTLIGTELPVGKRNLRRRRVLLASAGIGLACLSGVVWWNRGGTNRPSLRERGARTRVGNVVPLFNGVNTGGWQIDHGNWLAIPDEAVLEGTDGGIARLLPRRRDLGIEADDADQPPRWYRLEALLRGDLETDPPAASELHFGVCQGSNTGTACYVLRRTAEFLTLGQYAGEGEPFVPDSEVPPVPLNPDQDAAVELERLPAGWFIEVNGQPMGSLPLEARPRPELRLSADGTARFADLFIQAEVPQPVR
jgi:hypothetical protein